jgi:RNA polymerase-binding transcription factor DksA
MAKQGSKSGGRTKAGARPAKSAKLKAAPKKSTPARLPAKATGKKPVRTDREIKELLGPAAYSKADLQKFREMILQKRQETIEELDTLKESIMDVTTGEYVSESSNYSLHMEQGTDAMEREKTFLFASRGSKFVHQLDDALARIDAGTYGTCKVCNLLIPKDRLEAVPTATTCTEFKNTGVPCERGRLALARMKQQQGKR